MSKFLLVGTRHAMSSEVHSEALMTTEQMNLFGTRVGSRITDDSLLLVEGVWRDTLLERGAPEYRYELGTFARVLGTSKPSLGFFDPREKDAKYHLAMYRRWAECFDRLFRLSDRPVNVGETLDLIRAQTYQIEMLGRPSRADLDVARAIDKANRDFNRSYIQAMKRYASRHDFVVLVSGAAHSIAISLHTGWPLELLFGPESGEFVYQGYVGTQVCPALILKAL